MGQASYREPSDAMLSAMWDEAWVHAPQPWRAMILALVRQVRRERARSGCTQARLMKLAHLYREAGGQEPVAETLKRLVPQKFGPEFYERPYGRPYQLRCRPDGASALSRPITIGGE